MAAKLIPRGLVRAKLPKTLKGRVSFSTRTPVVRKGPVFQVPHRAVRAQQPKLRISGRVTSNRGAPVRNPTSGPVFRPFHWAVQAVDPLPRRGRTYSSPVVPVIAPPPAIKPPGLSQAVRAKLQSAQRGRITSSAVTQSPVILPPVISSPRKCPVRARFTPPSRGRVTSSSPANTARSLSVARAGPARAWLPSPGRGRTYFSPMVRQAIVPPPAIRIPGRSQAIYAKLPALRISGRVTSNPGIKVSPPVVTVAHILPRGPVRAAVSPVQRGRAYSSATLPPVKISIAPVRIASRGPVRSRTAALPRGRVRSDPGTLKPPAIVTPAPFRRRQTAVRAQLPRGVRAGRVASNPGAPVRNPPPVVPVDPESQMWPYYGHEVFYYSDYVDLDTEKMLRVTPGGSYRMRIISGRPGLTCPPPTGHWSPGYNEGTEEAPVPVTAPTFTPQQKARRDWLIEGKAKPV